MSILCLSFVLSYCFTGPDGQVQTAAQHPAVPTSDIELLDDLINRGIPFDDAIHLLRRTHFPFDYDPEPWVPGSFIKYHLLGK